jgi:hypothetical protein
VRSIGLPSFGFWCTSPFNSIAPFVFPPAETERGCKAQSEARLTAAAEDGAACGALSSVSDLAATVEALRKAGARFRNDIVTGIGGKQILLEDPSGNPIELFEPTLPEARLSTS